MEAVREIINSELLSKIIDLPEKLKNRKVEVVIMPVEEQEIITEKKTLRGRLSEYKDINLIKEEGRAWEQAAVEKHGNS